VIDTKHLFFIWGCRKYNMEQNWFRERYGLEKIDQDEYDRHKKRLIFLSLLENDRKITPSPKLTPKPNRTFKEQLKFNFTPIPKPEFNDLTADQIVDYHPYMRKLKKEIEEEYHQDNPFKI